MENDTPMMERTRAAQETFTPYIHVDGESTVPNGITLFGLSGGKWNLIGIPQTILDVPIDDQLAAVPELMRAYLLKYDGQCPFFGAVTGFKLVRLRDYFQFDGQGVLLKHVEKQFRRGQVSVELG